jgi:hypothetical protein
VGQIAARIRQDARAPDGNVPDGNVPTDNVPDGKRIYHVGIRGRLQGFRGRLCRVEGDGRYESWPDDPPGAHGLVLCFCDGPDLARTTLTKIRVVARHERFSPADHIFQFFPHLMSRMNAEPDDKKRRPRITNVDSIVSKSVALSITKYVYHGGSRSDTNRGLRPGFGLLFLLLPVMFWKIYGRVTSFEP